MIYRIDSTPVPSETRTIQYQREATIVLVGCGGTGGFLADSICRLLIDRPADLYLVDPDRVEPHNVARQAFDRTDVGHFKAEVLAMRLARRYSREIGYSVLPYDHELHAQVFGATHSRLNLLVGAVDNVAARRAIAATIGSGTAMYGTRNERVWWLDCGNGQNAGQVLLGNATQSEGLRHAFNPQLGLCRALPAPSLQRPDLLEAPPEPRHAPDCAEAIAHGDQGPTINQVVAVVAASYVEKLLTGTCCWMACYFDLDDGMLRCSLAEPKHVAEISGLHVKAVAPSGRRAPLNA